MKTDLFAPIIKAVAFAIAIAALVAAASYLTHVFLVRTPAQIGDNVNSGMDNAYAKAKQIVKDIDRALHFTPRVTISGTVIITQTASIAELSMVERNFTDDYSWDYTYFGSTKRMKISGDFIAKAGYDLTQLPSIDISADGANVTVVMPPAKITSNELIRERVIQDESGWWNEISLSDRENVQNQFVKHARAAIAASDIRSEADVRLRNQIDKIIRHDIHQPVTIVQPPKH